jgi:hypothetical protein
MTRIATAFAAAFAFLGACHEASAQSMMVSGNPTPLQGSAAGLKVDGSAVVQPVTPKTGAFTTAGCTVGASSAQCLAAATATNHVQIQNVSASISIACSWGGTAVLNNSGSIMLAPGQSALWGPSTSGIPATALNCIAGSASTPLYLEYN